MNVQEFQAWDANAYKVWHESVDAAATLARRIMSEHVHCAEAAVSEACDAIIGELDLTDALAIVYISGHTYGSLYGETSHDDCPFEVFRINVEDRLNEMLDAELD